MIIKNPLIIKKANLQAKSVTPKKTSQTITADSGYDGLSEVDIQAVTSSIDINITAGNIKKDVTILGVTGAYEDRLPALLQKTITSINASAFGDITSISPYQFEGCASLASVKFPSSITKVEQNSFYGCSSLSEIDLKCCTSIGVSAFYGCSNLSKVIFYQWFLDKLASISSNAFENCSKLETISLGESLKYISGNPFKGCSRLREISLSSSNTTFEVDSDKRILVRKSTGEIVVGALNGVSSYIIPDKSNSTSSTYITRIGSYAFYGFTNLNAITLGQTMSSIHTYAFADTGLRTLKINRTTPPTLASSNALPSTITRIEVPSNSLSTYQSATNWSTFADKMVGV